MDQLGFVIDPPSARIRVLRWAGGGCRPAEAEEIAMWERIARLEEALHVYQHAVESGMVDSDLRGAYEVARKALEQQ